MAHPTATIAQPDPPPKASVGAMDPILSQFSDLNAQAEKITSENVSATKDIIGQMKANNAAAAAVPMPGNVNVGPRPQMAVDTMQALGNPMTLLAIFGSLLTRRPMVAALNAASQAMQGYAQGNRDAYERATQAWEDNLRMALQNHEDEWRRWQETVNQIKDVPTLQAELSAQASINHDQMALMQLKSGNLDALLQYKESMARQAEAAQARLDVLAAQRWTTIPDAEAERMGLGSGTYQRNALGEIKQISGTAGARILTPEEAKALNLQPDRVWQVDKTGKIGQVSGSQPRLVLAPDTNSPTGMSYQEAKPGQPGIPPAMATLMERKKQVVEGVKERQKAFGGIVLEDIDRATDIAKNHWATGFTGNIMSAVPGTPAYNLKELITGIGGNITIDVLNQMRSESPTGSAFGNVTEFEDKLMQSVYGSLSQSQTRDQFLYNLNRLHDTYMDIVHGPGMWQPTGRPDADAVDAILAKPADKWTSDEQQTIKDYLGQ